jgi:hypothetical protein
MVTIDIPQKKRNDTTILKLLKNDFLIVVHLNHFRIDVILKVKVKKCFVFNDFPLMYKTSHFMLAKQSVCVYTFI